MYANGVFEGGGVKGIGIVGAVSFFEDKGYVWKNLAGTSSGSIIASFLAAGYKGKDLKQILLDLDYKIFMNKTKLQSLPLIGDALGILCEKGIYSGDEIENWVEDVLKATGKTKFKDVSIDGQSRLKIIAADITGKEIIILPDELGKYGIDPMEFKISKAVRMSCSIPFYFKPYKLRGKGNSSYIVDGGILSNFPIWIFDTKETPQWATLGFKIVEPPSHTSLGKTDIISYILDIIDTVISKNESRFINDLDRVRITTIPSMGIKSTDFSISKEKSLKLYNMGYTKAYEFYKTWSFEKYLSMQYGYNS